MITTRTTMARTTYRLVVMDAPGQVSGPLSGGGANVQREALDVRDHGLASGVDRQLVYVARGPRRAAIFDAARLPRLEARRNDDAIAERESLLDGAGSSAHELVDAAAEAHHGHERKYRERQPLRPVGPRDSGETQQADDRGRDAEKHEVELRVEHEHVDRQRHGTHDEPSPPRHSTTRCCWINQF